MTDTTAKHDILEGGTRPARFIPTPPCLKGQLNKNTPDKCRDCDLPLVPIATWPVPDGHALHGAHGYCCLHYRRRFAAGKRWDGPAPEPKQWRAADLVAEWEFLRAHRGYDRETAAKALGVKPSTLTTAAWRLRKYAERDKLRAEIAAAEAEAHRINDDMIAYAARKRVAA